MPIIWFGWVNAPKRVLANTPFKIKWKVWWLTWPFKKFKLYCTITDDDGVISRGDYNIFPISFIWRHSLEQEFHSGIKEPVTLKITIGLVKNDG